MLQYFLATGALNWYTTPAVGAWNSYYWMGLEFDGLYHRWLDGNHAGTGAVYNDNPYAHFGYIFQVRGMQPLWLVCRADCIAETLLTTEYFCTRSCH